MALRILVVDDEPLASAHVGTILSSEFAVDVVGTCANAGEARAAVRTLDPDAVFLDIEMPGESGIELAREADEAGRPLVVFVTAHSRYALEAYDVAPVDFILKPADPQHCRRVIRRLLRITAARGTAGPPGKSASAERYLSRVFVKQAGRLEHVAVSDISHIESLDNYVKLYTGGKSRILRGRLSVLESRLDPSVFFRTHRSFIVNISRVREMHSISHGDLQLVMDSGMRVPLSRNYRDRLNMFILFESNEGE